MPPLRTTVHDALRRLGYVVALNPTTRADLAVLENAIIKLRTAANGVVQIDAGGPPFFANAQTPISGDRLQALHDAYEATA